MRRLIINADDFGLTPGVNRGILDCHRKGIVTATTLMANSRAFDDAVRTTRAEPGLDVGCHIVLVNGEPLVPRELVPTLVTGDGNFRESIIDLAGAAFSGAINRVEIAAEATAQIRKLQQAGVNVSHIDTHKHAHMFPRILDAALNAAQACDVRAIRNPYAPVQPLRLTALAKRPWLWTRYTETKLLRRLGARFRQRIESEGMVTTDGTFGIVSTGALDLDLFRAVIGCIPDGTWEFVCHPGYKDTELETVRTRLRGSRPRELEVLTSAEARVFLEEQGIELISYRDLIALAINRGHPPAWDSFATGDA